MDDDAIRQFTGITGASDHTANFYLEQTQGDLEEAIEHFYANGGTEAPQPAPGAAGAAAGAAAAAAAAGQPARPAGGSRRVPTGNIRGFGDLGGEEESEEDEDQDNEYYAGGAKSGVAVRGGPREGHKDRVADLFDEARKAGAQEGRPEDLHDSGAGFRAFSGGARTLTGGAAAEAPTSQAAQRPQQEHRRVSITFYRNGVFTVDDGEPRSVGDPANLPFMEAIMAGRCPPELDPGNPNVTIDVNLIRRDEDYQAPAKPKVVAFAGSGRKLGGDEGASTSSAAAAAAAAGPAASGRPPMVTWEGPDESHPTTSIQLRLADGSRMVAKFNLTHTVADIRRFIHASRPEMPLSYRLVTAFPAQQLDDDSATIEGAGLANSVIIQK